MAKNSAIQARLDEAKKTIRLEKSQLKNSKRKKEKAVQVNSLNSTCRADTETVEDIQVNVAAIAAVAADNVKETSDSDSAHPWPSPGNAAVSAATQECDATEQRPTRRSSPLPGRGRSL